MAVAQRELALGRLLAGLLDGRQIERGGKPGPVDAGLAVNQDRLLRLVHDVDQGLGLGLRQPSAGLHAKIDHPDAEPGSLVDLVPVPGGGGVLAAQIEHRSESVRAWRLASMAGVGWPER